MSDPVDLEGPGSLLPPFTLALITFLLPLLQTSLNPKEKDLMETFLLGLSVPWSLSLCIMSGCGCLYLFPSAAEGTFSDDG